MSDNLEKIDLAVIINPKLFYTPNIGNHEENPLLKMQLMLLDNKFTSGSYYKESLIKYPELQNQDLRLNIFYVFINMFHKKTIGKLFDLSHDIVIYSVLTKFVILLKTYSEKEKHYIKPSLLLAIIKNMLEQYSPADIDGCWEKVKDTMLSIMAPNTYQPIIESVSKTVKEKKVKVTIN